MATDRVRLLVLVLLLSPGFLGAADIHEAALRGQFETVRRLLTENPALAQAADADGWTALHFASATNRLDTVELLLRHGSDPNARTKDDGTPLHVAVAVGRLHTVQRLIDHGADVNAKSKNGTTPLMLALREGHDDIRTLLREHGATFSGLASVSEAGELGNVQRIDFEGNRAYSNEVLRIALLSDPAFLLAAHPLAPRAGLIETLTNRLAAGYLFAGFPEARVSATPEGNRRLRVRIHEGPRFKTGEIRVHGARRVPVEPLVQCLTQPRWKVPDTTTGKEFRSEEFALTTTFTTWASLPDPPRFLDSSEKKVEPADPVWEPGTWARFRAGSCGYLGSVTNALRELGFLAARVRVALRPDAARGLADLEIHLVDEGDPAVIGEIHISGNRRNATAAVLEHLGVEQGQPLTQKLVTELEFRLWNSARFRAYRIVPEPLPGRTNQFRLQVDLTEHDEVTPLGEPLTRDETVFLKLREWVLAAFAGGNDLVADIGDIPRFPEPFRCAHLVVGRDGLALSTGPNMEAAGGRSTYGFLLSEDRFLFNSLAHGRKWASAHPRHELTVTCSLLPERDPTANAFSLLTLAGGWQKALKADARLLKFDVMLAPVCFLDLAHGSNNLQEIAPGRLVLTTESLRFEVESATGRLIELSTLPGSNALPARVRFEAGALGRAAARIDRLGADARNFHDPAHPLSAPAAFLLAEQARVWLELTKPTAAQHRQHEEAIAIVERLLRSEVLVPLDRTVMARRDAGADRFRIPPEHPEDAASTRHLLIMLLSAHVFQWADALFPSRSWPWTLAREAVYVVGGQGQYTGYELDRLYKSPDTGPIGCWVTAQLLLHVDTNRARVFAERGLDRLSAADFQRDMSLLFKGETVLQQCLIQGAAALRQLTPQELSTLRSAASADTAELLNTAVQSLREDPDRPLQEALGPTLQVYWDRSLRKSVEARLRRVLNRTTGTEPESKPAEP